MLLIHGACSHMRGCFVHGTVMAKLSHHLRANSTVFASHTRFRGVTRHASVGVTRSPEREFVSEVRRRRRLAHRARHASRV